MELIRSLHMRRGLRKSGIAVKCRRGYYGVERITHKPELIVSLTSHPGRIETVDRAIITLLNQTYKPDHVILWLADSQFPGRENDLPRRLTRLMRHGLEIMWCEDIRSYKKLIPTLRMFPEATIITVDDDWYYRSNMVEELVKEHNRHPDDIISNEITHPHFDENGNIESDSGEVDYRGTASFFHKMLGGSGTLYPPGKLYGDVADQSIFMKLAPTNDDIWFWAMAVLHHTKVRVPEKPVNLYAMTDAETQALSSLAKENEENDLYLVCMNNLFSHYPKIKQILQESAEVAGGDE